MSKHETLKIRNGGRARGERKYMSIIILGDLNVYRVYFFTLILFP